MALLVVKFLAIFLICSGAKFSSSSASAIPEESTSELQDRSAPAPSPSLSQQQQQQLLPSTNSNIGDDDAAANDASEAYAKRTRESNGLSTTLSSSSTGRSHANLRGSNSKSEKKSSFFALMEGDSERHLGQTSGCCSTNAAYSAMEMCSLYGQDCYTSGSGTSGSGNDEYCMEDGFSFIGLSFSVNVNDGNKNSYPLNDQFPMDRIIDRDNGKLSLLFSRAATALHSLLACCTQDINLFPHTKHANFLPPFLANIQST
jgi:hypothetical protein